jgi:MoxR-like ATPase
MDEEALLKKRLEELEKRYQQGLFGGAEDLEPIKEEKLSEAEPEESKLEKTKPEEFSDRTENVKREYKSKPEGFEGVSKSSVKKTPVKKAINGESDKSEEVSSLPDVELPENSDYSQEVLSHEIEDDRPDEQEIKTIAEKIKHLRKEMGKVVMGQDEIINGLILGLLCDAHVLVEGVPGIAKTLAIRALASVSGCSVKRIQFTVDMLPTDIIGITNYTPEKGFEVVKGPIFANFVIADEINRAPPKTQSALMEGMQEKQVTIGRENFELPLPFFVMATENPIENAGVYPLPEAQVDRFLFKLIMDYPKIDAEKKVLETNITLRKFEEFGLKAVTSPKEIMKMQQVVKRIYLDDNIKNYILSIIRKTREKDFLNAEYLSYGCSPRASIGLFIASKARALMQGRNYVLPEDVKDVAFDVLRHRLILSYKATIKKISPEDIIKEILSLVKVE